MRASGPIPNLNVLVQADTIAKKEEGHMHAVQTVSKVE